MKCLSHGLLLLLAFIVFFSFMVFTPTVSARPIPTPSTPQVTVAFVDNSSDVPPTVTSTIDPYNGQNITTNSPGYHLSDKKIQLTIKNQAYPSIINGNQSNLYFNVRMKGHYATDWSILYSCSTTSAGSLIVALSSGDTVLTFPANYRINDEVDFQVQAVLGYEYSYETYFYGQTSHTLPLEVNTFNYESSGWSQTQTFTMPDTSASTIPKPSPSIPEFPIAAIIPLFATLLFAAVLIRKHISSKPQFFKQR
jgi:hypothetical protein